MKYIIAIEETITDTFELEADNLEEATETAIKTIMKLNSF